jgi:hypothetical protein
MPLLTPNQEDVYPAGSEKPDGPAALLALLQQQARNRGAGLGLAADSAALTALIADIDFSGFTILQADTAQAWVRKSGATIPLPVNTRRKLDATSDTVALIPTVGQAKIAGAAATGVGATITFPTAYLAGTVPVVVCSFAGSKATGAFDPGNTAANLLVDAAADTITNAGFAARIRVASGTLSAAADYYLHYIAWGVPA